MAFPFYPNLKGLMVMADEVPQHYHRINLCIEVPAINQPGGGEVRNKKKFRKSSLVRFEDMLTLIGSLLKSREDAGGVVGGARYRYDIEWNVESELPDQVLVSGGVRRER